MIEISSENDKTHPNVRPSTSIVKYKDKCYKINNENYYNPSAVAKAPGAALGLGYMAIAIPPYFILASTIVGAMLKTSMATNIALIFQTGLIVAAFTPLLNKLYELNPNAFEITHDNVHFAFDYAAANYFGLDYAIKSLTGAEIFNMDHIACAPHA